MVQRIAWADSAFGAGNATGVGRLDFNAFGLFESDPTPHGATRKLASVFDAPLSGHKLDQIESAALKAAGKDKGVTIVAVDGGCNGVKMIKTGIIGGDSQQYPLLMAADGVQQVVDFLKNGKKPESIDSGEKLITDHPVSGLPSISADEATKLCWG